LFQTMTRVNLVSPADLADQHLFAEWRELKMIPAKVRKNLDNSVPMDNLPDRYTMSTGHVRFFYNKMDWLYRRHKKLTAELVSRKFALSDYDPFLGFIYDIPRELRDSEWYPTKEDIQLNINRISERLHQRPTWYRYYGEIMAPEFFINRYNQQLLVDTIIA
jgi:deoxyribonuclease (pyrimidine dimer)